MAATKKPAPKPRRVKGKLVLTSRALLARTSDKLQALGQSVRELRALGDVKENTVLSLRHRLDLMNKWRALDHADMEGLRHKLAIVYAMAQGQHDLAIVALIDGPKLRSVMDQCNDVTAAPEPAGDVAPALSLSRYNEHDTVTAQRIETEMKKVNRG